MSENFTCTTKLRFLLAIEIELNTVACNGINMLVLFCNDL